MKLVTDQVLDQVRAQVRNQVRIRVSKQVLLPVGMKPMIFHAIDKFIEVNIRSIMVITGIERAGSTVQFERRSNARTKGNLGKPMGVDNRHRRAPQVERMEGRQEGDHLVARRYEERRKRLLGKPSRNCL